MQQKTQQLTVIPYSPSYLNSSFKRVIVKPIPVPERTTDAGLYIASDAVRICERGIVFASCKDSILKPGDTILYKKLDRTEEHLDIISYEDDLYDVIYENELWAVNNQPFNKIFVDATSGMDVNESGLLLPDSARGVTQKGIVFRASEDYCIKPGDRIEYRKSEQNMYPTIDIEGNIYDVLNETDVFLINGKVAPYRIIVRIDKVAQQAKQATTDSGLLRSQLFLFMKANLQYGEVMEIGEEAQKFYPDMKVGDVAILHHSIEDKTGNYRIIRQEASKQNVLLYEHRIINAWETSNREILGRIVNRKEMIVSPYGKSVFLNWDFDVMTKAVQSSLLFTDFETNLDKCHNLEDLSLTIDRQKKTYIAKAQAKVKGTHKVLAATDPNFNRDEFDRRETAYKEAQADALKVASYLQANHLVICKRVDNGERVVLPYKELYPIEILGKRFLIGWSDYILANIVVTGD